MIMMMMTMVILMVCNDAYDGESDDVDNFDDEVRMIMM